MVTLRNRLRIPRGLKTRAASKSHKEDLPSESQETDTEENDASKLQSDATIIISKSRKRSLPPTPGPSPDELSPCARQARRGGSSRRYFHVNDQSTGAGQSSKRQRTNNGVAKRMPLTEDIFARPNNDDTSHASSRQTSFFSSSLQQKKKNSRPRPLCYNPVFSTTTTDLLTTSRKPSTSLAAFDDIHSTAPLSRPKTSSGVVVQAAGLPPQFYRRHRQSPSDSLPHPRGPPLPPLPPPTAVFNSPSNTTTSITTIAAAAASIDRRIQGPTQAELECAHDVHQLAQSCQSFNETQPMSADDTLWRPVHQRTRGLIISIEAPPPQCSTFLPAIASAISSRIFQALPTNSNNNNKDSQSEVRIFDTPTMSEMPEEGWPPTARHLQLLAELHRAQSQPAFRSFIRADSHRIALRPGYRQRVIEPSARSVPRQHHSRSAHLDWLYRNVSYLTGPDLVVLITVAAPDQSPGLWSCPRDRVVLMRVKPGEGRPDFEALAELVVGVYWDGKPRL
ncbi:MAG: hypothetical protein M1825_003444 [Sarcosagium campestre]|nr:MAG: hypothetical protein M1825_003444 [Sarcosagium campestre]